MAQQVQFVYLTQAEYDALGTKDAARLYFTSDTGRIYRGTVAYAPQRVFYGTCSTTGSTAAKVVTCPQFTSSDFVAGTKLIVKFTLLNSNTTPSITIGGSTKRIYRYGTTNPATYTWYGGQMVEFVYSGTYWLMVNPGPATTTYEGVVKLNDTLTSTSTTQAATANAVKQLNDKFADYVSIADLEDGLEVDDIEAKSITIDGKVPSLEGHTHGNITSDGALQDTDIAIANGDKLVVTDASGSSKVARTSLAFDGSTTTQFLSKKGTWEAPVITGYVSKAELATAIAAVGSIPSGDNANLENTIVKFNLLIQKLTELAS